MHRLTACILLALCGVLPARAVDVLTSRNTPERTGVNAEEAALTPARLKTANFGKLWTLYADGQVVAQPLYVSGLQVDAGAVQGRFNAVLVATMHNTVYLYDADSERPGPDGRNLPLWATWLGQPRPSGKEIDMWSTSDPEWGILGTPVIDAAKQTVYVVAWHDDGGNQNHHYRLHALRLKDGTPAMPAVELQGPGLDARKQKQRTGLLLQGGVLYIGLGGDGSRGLLLAHDAATLQQRAAWQVTPNGNDGGLWQAGVAPAADAEGNVYLMTGNGSFDAAKGNFGMSFVKLRLEGNQITVKDWFTPCNQAFLNNGDWDLGSSGPVLIPGAKLVVGAGKWAQIFLLSTERLGGHTPAPPANAKQCANPTALQQVDDDDLTNHHLHGSPVFWQGSRGAQLYLWRENDLLHAFPFVNRRLVNKPVLGVDALPPGMPGGMLSLSSLGKQNGILWALAPLDGDANTHRGARGVLRAIDAEDVTRTLWSSEQMAARDRPGLFAKYVPPTIADGKVFVATYGDAEELAQYGPGPQRPQRFPARYQVAVYGFLPAGPMKTIDQAKANVQLVQASVAPLPAMDLARCRTASGGSLDCTEELQRVAAAPSFERVVVPVGHDFVGCQLARLTLASDSQAMQGAQAIGFYASDVTAGQFSVDHGNTVVRSAWKEAGGVTLKNERPAVLHEFAGLVNCALGVGLRAELRFKPNMQFQAGTPPAIYRDWDLAPENHRLGGDVQQIDRRNEVLK